VNKRSLTTCSLRHCAENGLSDSAWRARLLAGLDALQLGRVRVTFPFGDVEVYAWKAA